MLSDHDAVPRPKFGLGEACQGNTRMGYINWPLRHFRVVAWQSAYEDSRESLAPSLEISQCLSPVISRSLSIVMDILRVFRSAMTFISLPATGRDTIVDNC